MNRVDFDGLAIRLFFFAILPLDPWPNVGTMEQCCDGNDDIILFCFKSVLWIQHAVGIQQIILVSCWIEIKSEWPAVVHTEHSTLLLFYFFLVFWLPSDTRFTRVQQGGKWLLVASFRTTAGPHFVRGMIGYTLNVIRALRFRLVLYWMLVVFVKLW